MDRKGPEMWTESGPNCRRPVFLQVSNKSAHSLVHNWVPFRFTLRSTFRSPEISVPPFGPAPVVFRPTFGPTIWSTYRSPFRSPEISVEQGGPPRGLRTAEKYYWGGPPPGTPDSRVVLLGPGTRDNRVVLLGALYALNVCVYACMHVCMYVRMFVYMYV